ncbi:FIST N-terminal domain-containing protein [uncultured Paracoccus sp.]|uniref:FIST N-terminal domain-containing protein n=1 Tax=uncultured Paracoccus sp. TaxID=189685 RepID=UPI0025CCC967|nr:FIST N-terminal domain-containing protein [uncultured Paracoccus sp.]
MDGGDPVAAPVRVAAEGRGQAPGILRRAQAAAADPAAVPGLASDLGPDLGLVLLFVSPTADFPATMAAASRAFGATPVLGCTTAGEIAGGYVEDRIIAVGFPARDFAAETIAVADLDRIEPAALIDTMIRARQRLASSHPGFAHEFAYLMVDGITLREDALMAVLGHGLGPVPLFGGSAGDGTRFQQSYLAQGARVCANAALLTFVRTRCPIKVFSFDHLDAATGQMVVTGADPARRRVREINAAPAAAEYARLLGKPAWQLDPFTFAAHPLVVRVGGRYHVRSIQRVENGTDLVFFSAIDEGVVLTLATPRDIARSLDTNLAGLAAAGPLDSILACDCILRRIEAQQKQQTTEVSRILARHNVTGFSTYGEQFGAMHVNLTMTGVAIYAPDGDG